VLSDREREALHEIQRQLLVEDPAFGQSFETRTHRLARRPWYQQRGLYTMAIVVVAMLGVLMLVMGSPTNALVLAAVVALIWEARGRTGNTIPKR